MGTEILILFIPIPIALWIFDLVRIIKRKNVLKHSILLVFGVTVLGYMSLSSYLGDWNPMQGFVIGSLFYGPGYLALFIISSALLNKQEDKNDSGNNA